MIERTDEYHRPRSPARIACKAGLSQNPAGVLRGFGNWSACGVLAAGGVPCVVILEVPPECFVLDVLARMDTRVPPPAGWVLGPGGV